MYWTLIIVAIIVGFWLLDLIIELLDSKSMVTELPEKLKGIYDDEKYQTSQAYGSEKTRFGLIQASLSMIIMLLMIFLGGFNWVDQIALQVTDSEILRGLIFGAILMAGSSLIS